MIVQARLDRMQWTDENNVTEEIVIYNVTSLRVDPDYVYYYIHWTRSVGFDISTVHI